MAYTIYVLALEDGRYYVGKTKDISDIFCKRYRPSPWIKKFKPVALERVFENVSLGDFEEDKVTKEYMDKYGIDMVRGGSYSQFDLSDHQRDVLNIEIKTISLFCRWNYWIPIF